MGKIHGFRLIKGSMTWMMIIMLVIGLIGNIPNSYSTPLVSPSMPLTSGIPVTATFTSPSQGTGITQTDSSSSAIRSAVDGDGNGVTNGGTTTSKEITFLFAVSAPFECRLDGKEVVNCQSGKPYPNLSIGFHTFVVRINDADVPFTFTWTITDLTPPLVSPQLRPSTESTSIESSRENNANQIGVNTATLSGNIQNNQITSANAVTAATQANSLNPVLKRCDPVKTAYAIYDIAGNANLRKLLENTSGPGITVTGSTISAEDVPISLLLWVDTRVTDSANQIIDNEQPYMKAELIVFPGDTENQNSINFDLTKITTECTQASFVNTKKVIQEERGESSSDLPNTVPLATLNPIFEQCLTATGNVQMGNADIGGTIPKVGTNPGVTLNPNLPTSSINSDGTSTLLDGTSVPFAQEVVGNAATASTANTQPPSPQSPNQLGGDLVDVVKYNIKGTINTVSLSDADGLQDLVFRIYNIFDPNRPPPSLLVITGESNNKQLAAKIEVDPGDTDNWKSLDLTLEEIATHCNSIPFVDNPKSIGTHPAEFYSVPVGLETN
jgi:hypothetical protein